MPVARLTFSQYQSSNENGGGTHPWSNVQGAGSSSAASGAFAVRDPNSALMNWLQSNNDGARGSAAIPAGSTITGMVCGFSAANPSGGQTGGTYQISIMKNGPVVASKNGSLPQGGSIGVVGASNDLWGLVGLTPDYFASGVAFGMLLNFPTISSNIDIQGWNGYLDIYYNDPVSTPASISASGGSNQSANVGATFPIALYAQVVDQGGNNVSGVSVTFRLPASGPSATFPGAVLTAVANTNSSGIAQSPPFTANATVGQWNPTCEVTANPALTGTYYETNTAVVAPPTPTTIVITQGNNQSAATGTAFSTPLQVELFDQYSNPMPNADINFVVPPYTPNPSGQWPGGGLVVRTVQTNSGGIATAPTLTANLVAGAWQATAGSSTGVAPDVNFNLTNIQNTAPPAAASLVNISGNSQTAATFAAYGLPLRVRVLDQYGLGFPGQSVVFTIPSPNNGTFVGGGIVFNGTTDANGYAQTSTITAGGDAGQFGVSVDSAGLISTAFTLTNIDPAVVTSVSIYDGNNQKTPPSTAFAKALSVRLTNALGAGVPGLTVVFTAPASGASCTFGGQAGENVLTNAQGYATSLVPVANATLGQYTVTAAYGAFAAPFSMQNGLNYLPEVCTTAEPPPQGCVTTTFGGQGNAQQWQGASLVGQPGGGGAFAQVFQEAPNTDRSYMMLTQPQPASWTDGTIKDNARVNSITVQGWHQGIPNPSNPTEAYCIFYNNAVIYVYQQAGPSAAGDSNWVQWNPLVFTMSSPSITGAMLKSAAFGIGVRANPDATSGPSSGVRVNGLTMIVCYQNPDEPVEQNIQVPLLFCDF